MALKLEPGARLVVATHNPGKARELEEILEGRFHLTAAHLPRLKPDAVIMHPLPRREEIAVEIDSDPRAMYWRQARNGMWIRAALMLLMFEKDGEINQYYADLVR